MTWQDAGRPSGSTSSGLFDGDFSWGLVLLGIVGLTALVIVCSLGFIARMRDRAAERKEREAKERAEHQAPPPA